MVRLLIDTYWTAQHQPGELTSQEVKEYVAMCLKPGKSTGPDRCPNELTKTMRDKEFQIVKIWVKEILTEDTSQHQATMNSTIHSQYDSGTKGSLRLEEVADLDGKGFDPWGSFPGDVLGQTPYIVRELEEKDQYAALVTVMKVVYFQALMDERFQAYTPCNGDIATMIDVLRRVQVAAASAVALAKGQKGVGEEVPGDENDSSEVAACKATEKESAQQRWRRQCFGRCGRMWQQA